MVIRKQYKLQNKYIECVGLVSHKNTWEYWVKSILSTRLCTAETKRSCYTDMMLLWSRLSTISLVLNCKSYKNKFTVLCFFPVLIEATSCLHLLLFCILNMGQIKFSTANTNHTKKYLILHRHILDNRYGRPNKCSEQYKFLM